jgi:dUTP pyrophosphatase
MKIFIQRLHANAVLPKYAKDLDAGADLYTVEDCTVNPNSICKIKLGVAVSIPNGYMGLVLPRSGKATQGINCAPVPIDPSYTGEIHAIVHSASYHFIPAGTRIAQLVIIPFARAEFTTEMLDQRGDAGFNSTGDN